ncbi:hypothetical protein CYMTET_27847 [Cymbomonas tetramitiformis]|uniref:Uncharacterized protein n=1 Tax=Cymbomonas tetramitiformis TaxID=36881 RepID=A0AAE0FPA2_9CHLO|nr:hypothetical protein CYMTET_27847 [Cymbomonas tetramitiformis]
MVSKGTSAGLAPGRWLDSVQEVVKKKLKAYWHAAAWLNCMTRKAMRVNAPFLRCEEKVYGPEGLQDETSIRPRNLYVYLELVVTEVGEIQRDLDDKVLGAPQMTLDDKWAQRALKGRKRHREPTKTAGGSDDNEGGARTQGRRRGPSACSIRPRTR